MKVYFDTSTLVSLVRNYYPFDPDFWDNWLQERIDDDVIRILPEVLSECERVAGGLVCKTFPWLDKKKVYKISDEDLATVLNPKFFRQVNEHFLQRKLVDQKRLSEIEISVLTDRWINDADGQLIIAVKANRLCAIVTEETETANDGKEFKKIPAIAATAYISRSCMTLPKYLNANGLRVAFHHKD